MSELQKFTVKLLPSGHTFTVEQHENILDAAIRQNIGVSYSCRSGACSACKGRVVEGLVQRNGDQERVLGAEALLDGFALLCRTEALSDISIEIKVSSADVVAAKVLPCRVERLERIHDVAILKLKLPASECFQFSAGQYIDILMKDGKARSFSLANAPHDAESLELHIRQIPGGTFSEYVFNSMKEREILRFKGPLGSFTVREDSQKPAVLVASGTGFAPIKSIVEHLQHIGDSRSLTLYWGARRPADLYLHDLVLTWVEKYPHFRYIPVVSDALPEDQWQGRTGFVHQAVLDDFASLADVEVYACGAPAMVEAAHQSFIHMRHLPEDAFFSDAFFQPNQLNTQQ